MKTTILLKSFAVAVLACTGLAGKSQTLTVEGTAPNLYIPYTVVPKDNFYSVGRQFNQSPKAIASFNNIVMNNGLKIGQKIKIPLTAQNFDAAGGGNETALTHLTASSETLSKIAANYKVTVQQLKQWNSLASDNLTPGTSLVIGYLKAQGAASNSVAASPARPVEVEVKTKPVAAEKKEEPKPVAKSAATPAAPKDTLMVVTSDPPPTTTHATEEAPKEPAKEKRFEPVVNETPEERPAPAKTGYSQPQIKEVVVKQPAKNESSRPTTRDAEERKTIDISSTGSIEGAFANIFASEARSKSLSSVNGEAATFKSTSGWQDRKYYVLINDVPAGTILKISAGDKAVYAKVLGSMPEMKENTGLLLRLSNSAASYLGIVDAKFPVEVTYYK